MTLIPYFFQILASLIVAVLVGHYARRLVDRRIRKDRS